MKARTSLILLVFAVGLAAFVWLWEKDQPGTTQRLALAGKLIPNLDPEKVDRLTLRRGDGIVVASRQKDLRWRLEQPLDEPADSLVLQGIVRDLAEAPVLARLAPSDVKGGESATGLGADAAVATMVVDGRDIVVRVGAQAIGAGRRYVQVGTAQELVLVDDVVARAIERPVEQLRDHTLFQAATIDVQRFSIEHAQGSTLRFERRNGEAWWITAPFEDAADNGKVSGMLSQLLSLRAETFLTTPPSTLPGKEAPWLRIEFADAQGGSKGTLTVGDAVVGTTLRFAITDRRSEPFHLRTTEVESEFRKPSSDWRSMLAIDTTVWDVTELELRRENQRLLLRQAQADDGKKSWIAAEPSETSIDEGKVVELTSKLARVECKRFADDATWSSAGLDTPVATVTLRHEDRARYPDSVLWIGKSAGPNEVYAGVPGRRTVLVVDASLASELDPARLKR